MAYQIPLFQISSLVSAVVDEGAFVLLNALLHAILSGFLLTTATAVGARAVSSLVNFFMNHICTIGISGGQLNNVNKIIL